jgi:hypothetical protein
MSLFLRGKNSVPDNFYPLAAQGYTIPTNYSGETVTEITALQISAVMSCVGLLADSIAGLPFSVYQQRGQQHTMVPTPPWMVNPSPTITQYELIHQTMTSLALHGNAFLVVDRDDLNAPIGITPVHPQFVTVYSTDWHRRQYWVRGAQVDPNNILHIRWWTPAQALRGISPLEEQRTTIGIALAAQRHEAQFFGEGATPSSVLETDQDITPQQAQTLRETWNVTHNRHRKPAVLTNGLRWRPITTSAADMELDKAKQFQLGEIARIFRIPPHMIGAPGDSQTYQNVEQAGINFVQFTLLPWLRRLEEAFSSLLTRPKYIKFDTQEFLRADTLSRFNAHRTAIESGIRSPNEARRIEGLEPYDGGDRFWLSMNGNVITPEQYPLGVDANTET